MTEAQLRKQPPGIQAAVLQKQEMALLVRGETGPYICGRHQLDARTERLALSKRWNEYGIVAAQRRGHGAIWVVVAGLSGPSTLAVAKALRAKIARNTPAAEGGRHSAVLWALVEAHVGTKNVPAGDNRVLEGYRVVGEPRIWEGPYPRA